MINGIAAANHGVALAERLPRDADARFERGQIHLNAGARTGVLTGDQELPVGGIEVRHAVADFAFEASAAPRPSPDSA